MKFDHILGGIIGAFIGMLLLYIATKRRSARREETLSAQLDVERREAQNLLIAATAAASVLVERVLAAEEGRNES